MALPKAGNKTDLIVSYAMEVVGRIQGVVATDVLIPDAAKRQALSDIAAKIQAPTLALFNLFAAHQLQKLTAFRTQMGLGRGMDYVFERHVSMVSESVRTGPGRGSRESDAYRKVFEEGNIESYVAPTVREDPELCKELGRRLQLVEDFPAKAGLLDTTTKMEAAITPVAEGLRGMEEQQSKDFVLEVEARQAVIDALWVGKKSAEVVLGRDRALIGFLFFDFGKGDRRGTEDEGDGDGSPGGEGGGGAGPANG